MEPVLNEGRATIIGERGKYAASSDFLLRLDDLPPTVRRLALARACAILGEASDDLAAHPDTDALLDDLFAEVPEPISEVMLSQLSR